MPYSPQSHIVRTINHVMRLEPATVLDVGCGFGRWGFLCREFLDVVQGRVYPKDWQIRIDAVEAFEPYILDHHRSLYTNIYIEDLRECLERLDDYDVIIAGDVIEHFEKDEGLTLFERLHAKSRRGLLVNIPLGHTEQGEMYGNPWEAQRSEWELHDFAEYPSYVRLYHLHWGTYAAFTFPRDCTADQQAYFLLDDADYQREVGNHAQAETDAREALDLAPDNPEVYLKLASALIGQKRANDAVAVLDACLDRMPGLIQAASLLTRLLAALGKPSDAVKRIRTLLQRDDLDPQARSALEALLNGIQ
jgi:tetratricopeptide (TPR) repeat protein